MTAQPPSVSGAGAPAPLTNARNLVELLLERAREPAKVAAKHKVGGVWKEVTWGDVLSRVRCVSEGLIAEGVKLGDRVSIFANTSYDWAVADLGILGAGAQTVPIYASNTSPECEWILTNSGACAVFVDHDRPEGKETGRLARIEAVWDKCPPLKKAWMFDGRGDGKRVSTLAELEALGEKQIQAGSRVFEERVAAVGPDDTASFIYTSGTTGNPKGVELTHGNWIYETTAMRHSKLMAAGAQESVLLFLPLAHSFAKVVEACWLGLGVTLIFAEAIDKVVDNAQEVGPTVLPSVPRVFEKVFNKVYSDGTSAPGAKGVLFRWAMRQFDAYCETRNAGEKHHSLSFELARRLVFRKVAARMKARLGGRMKYFISGGAPLSRKIAYFFDMCGVQVLEGFGLTETSAATCINRPGEIKIGTVGPPAPGTEIKIAPDGEILIRGPGVMKGYHKDPAATREAIDADGWFHSGDIGEIDVDGYVRITDRKKDIIVTAGGKNVAPQNIESELKAAEPLVSEVMVYGDKRKFLSALITLGEESLRKFAKERGLAGEYAALTQHPAVREHVQAAVDRVNASLASYETLKKFAVLDHEFSQRSGELTPTLKVKRKVCSQKYKEILDGFYGEKYD